MRVLTAVVRVAAAAAILAAVVGQLLTSLAFWQQDADPDLPFLLVGFFSFFTILSNLFAALVLLVGAVLVIARPGDEPTWFAHARVSAVTYMVVTGIVYNLLLRGIELPQGSTLGWSNEVLHLVAPIVLLVDWLLAPGRRVMAWSALKVIVVFPLVWVAYTLVRGPFAIDARTGEPWYPYPFLNPALSANGYLSVAFYVVLIALVIIATGAGAIWVSRRRAGREGLAA